MKSILSFISILVFTTAFYAQKTNTNNASGRAPLTAKDSMICKEWKVTGIEMFGVSNAPNETQKNDGFSFLLDGTAFLTMDGVNKTGTWVTDKAKTIIVVKVDGDTWIHRFKISTLTKDQLNFEFQSVELVKTKYNCQPKKK